MAENGMFDNYPQPSDYTPNNRFCFHDNELDEIFIGGTAKHTFILNFLYSQYCTRFEIFYKQSITPTFTIDSSAVGSPYEMEVKDGKTYITVTLSQDVTALFKPYRDTFAQIKLYMTDGSVIFGDINNVLVIDTLDTDV